MTYDDPTPAEGSGMAGGPGYTPTPMPTATEAPYTPPVLDCGPYEVPGWLDGHGNPTVCINNCPWDGQTAAECHSPTPTPTPTYTSGPGVIPSPTPTPHATTPAPQVITPPATTTPHVQTVVPLTPTLADTGISDGAGFLWLVIAIMLIVLGSATLIAGIVKRVAVREEDMAAEVDGVLKEASVAALVGDVRMAAIRKGHAVRDAACRFYDPSANSPYTRAVCSLCRNEIDEAAA